MKKLDDDTVALMARRAYDIAACSPGVKVFLNDKKLPINKFEDYVKLYIGDKDVDEMDNPLNILYDKRGPRYSLYSFYLQTQQGISLFDRQCRF